MLCFNIRSIGSLWSSWYGDVADSTVSLFQYPLYRITLVVVPMACVPMACVPVSISALSDHFGRHFPASARQGYRHCFNIRSIGSLWSSSPIQNDNMRTLQFQYPLYRITLVVVPCGVAAAFGVDVSISALSDHFGRLCQALCGQP